MFYEGFFKEQSVQTATFVGNTIHQQTAEQENFQTTLSIPASNKNKQVTGTKE